MRNGKSKIIQVFFYQYREEVEIRKLSKQLDDKKLTQKVMGCSELVDISTLKLDIILKNKMEKIHLENPKQADSWVCICGNVPYADGFFPCDDTGKEVEPTPEKWPTHLYACDRCGRIIRQTDLVIVG